MVLAGLMAASPSRAQEVETLGSLRGVSPPGPPATDYRVVVKDEGWLRVLGKALFWDTAIGSDGVACASCHFHAGADPRTKNQLSPGLLARPLADDKFGETVFNTADPASALTGSGARAGANITLTPGDFPFHRLADPADRDSTIQYSTNDVMSSQGVFDGLFIGLRQTVNFKTRRRDFCRPGDDDIFVTTVAGVTKKVRRVEPRNTPTVVNAAFYHRNFWDGRANNVFNGVDVFGQRSLLRNPNARVVVQDPASLPRLEELALEDMSLASQAVGPPNSDFEMACGGRSFPDIGRKMMLRAPLAGQAVAATDSLLGTGSPKGNQIRGTGKGLKGTYQTLIQQAFQDRYWNAAGTYRIADGALVPDAAAGYSQAELNFSLFFGMALDAYQRTLISDRTPFDRHEEGTVTALTARERQGLEIFKGKGKCAACHNGPLLSNATIPPRQRNQLVESMVMGDGDSALYDGGFYNIGVRPTFEDIGLGGTDAYGNPLSFSRQVLSGNRVDRFGVDGPALDRVAVDGAFKTPTLRNVGLTAPYFHNGGEATLRQVVEFYNRGGNRRSVTGGDTTGSGANGQGPVQPGAGGSNLDADIVPLGLSDAEMNALVAFMLALTDQRVACHRAPFDHPELIVTNGSDQATATTGRRARDARLLLPAVGRAGFPAAACDPNTGDLFGRNLVGGMLRPLPAVTPAP